MKNMIYIYIYNNYNKQIIILYRSNSRALSSVFLPSGKISFSKRKNNFFLQVLYFSLRFSLKSKQAGIKVVKEFKNLNFKKGYDLKIRFPVPPQLDKVALALSGTVENLSQHKTVPLHSSASFDLNQIDHTDQIQIFPDWICF